MADERFTDEGMNIPDRWPCPIANKWPEHDSRSKASLDELVAMKNTLGKIQDHTAHLSKLDDISQSLISAATGRNQVSLISHLMIVLILGAIILVVLIRDSGIGLEISPSGLKIGEGHKKEGKP